MRVNKSRNSGLVKKNKNKRKKKQSNKQHRTPAPEELSQFASHLIILMLCVLARRLSANSRYHTLMYSKRL
jgi:hypothetical protein